MNGLQYKDTEAGSQTPEAGINAIPQSVLRTTHGARLVALAKRFGEARPDGQARRTTSSIPHINATSSRAITKTSRSNFLRAFHLLPADKQEAITTVYAFFRIVDDCVDKVMSPDEKQAALKFWEDEIIRAYRDKPAHPVIAELKTVIQRYGIPQRYFLGLIKGCRLDITKRRYETFAELYEYCYLVAGMVGLTCLKIFAYTSDTAEQMAVDLGVAFQLTNILRDVKQDLALGRVYLPAQEMKKFGYAETHLANGVKNEAFLRLMHSLAARAERYYQSAFAEFARDKDNKLAAARAMARVYHAILKKMIRKKFPVLRKRMSLNFIEKLWLLS